jgi:23S rRNA pseudouridine1911/1915/1917 synthase
MPNPKKIIVSEEESGQRLDVFLADKLKITRSQVQKMIAKDIILINEKLPKKAGDNLSTNDSITFKKEVSKSDIATKTETQKKTTFKIPETKIIAETSDYIVVEKPTGMLSHPTMAGETDTLADFITNKFPEIKKVGEGPARPGIVHRLDREASGLMVIARTQKMFNHLKEQFKTRTIEKEYTALVHDPVARNWGEINFPIARSETSARMAALPSRAGNDAKEAKTEFLVEEQFVNFSLLKVKIHTGRMHQIRVHFLAYDHPLVGDPLYFQKKQKRHWDEKLGRLFLHSTKLGFIDLEGIKQTFESPLPKELKNFLKEIK